VSWKAINAEQLKTALDHIPAQHLFHIFDVMADNLANNRSGFPDLIVFKGSEYCLIEVKGPGDQLQLSQKRWLKHFQQWGIPFQIYKVAWL